MRQQAVDVFEPLNTSRVSSDIVAQVLRGIKEGKLKTGDRLPSERDLAETLGVSRLTVRDAFRVLETKGLVQVKRGSLGGTFVSDSLAGIIGESLATLASMTEASAEDVTEARVILEVNSLPLICERATPEDLIQLDEVCQRRDDALAAGTYTPAVSAEFHKRLAQATHNLTLQLLVEAFYGPIVESLVIAAHASPPPFQSGTNDHREIIDAIRRRDVDDAQRIMLKHLRGTEQRLKLARK